MNLDSPYEGWLRERIEAIVPGAYERLEDIEVVETKAAERIAALIVGSCQGQNVGGITVGRKAFARLPSRWVEAHLREVVSRSVDLADEWEYRRLLEMLTEARSSLLSYYVDVGTRSTNPEVREAAEDWKHR